ncbi:MAG: hypothetical protein SFW67_15105 [Myxococcaceae bacterium]|nr:hypothetical protein [Myxococcaceae bacterium]
MRIIAIGLVIALGSGCVRRVASLPPEFASQPAPPEGSVDLVVLPDEPRPSWRVTGRTEQCLAPCAMRVGVSDRLVLTASNNDVIELEGLPADVVSARRAVLVPEPRSRALQVNGIVFTSLGAMVTVVAITLTAVGCSDLMRRSGVCTAGLVTGAVGVPLMGASILMLVGSAPDAHLVPVAGGGSGPAVALGPTGLWGRF